MHFNSMFQFYIPKQIHCYCCSCRCEFTDSPATWAQAVKLLFFLLLTWFTASQLCHLGYDGSLKPPASGHFFYLFREKMLKMQSNASVSVAEKPFLSRSKCTASHRGPRGGQIRGRDKHHESAETKTRDLSKMWQRSKTQ